MRLYWHFFQASMRRQFTYRAALLAGLMTNAFFGLLRASVMTALYAHRTEVSGVSLQDAITYTGIAQAVIGYLTLFGWYEIMNSIYTGEVGTDMLKPMSYFRFWMAKDHGRSMINLILRGIPIMALYALFYKITVPGSASQWIALLISLLFAWMVSFSWRFLVNLAGFWVPNAIGIGRFFFTLSWFLSGFMMPLRLMPEWFVKLCYLTPFPQMVNTVVEIYLGLLSGPKIIQALLLQITWILILVLASQIVLRIGIRRLEIYGG